MAYGDYYNPANKTVNAGDVVLASDINDINSAIDAGFEQVAIDITEISTGSAGVSQAWAEEDQGTRPDILVDGYSSKAYAIEAKGWATSVGNILEASTGLPLSGSVSAKTSATAAGSYASSASTSAGTATTQAGVATTQAGISTAQAGIATTQAGIATTQAGNASTSASLSQDWASKAVDSVVSGGKYSAMHYAQKASETVASLGSSISSIAGLVPAADRVPYYTGASTAALAVLTSAGRALIAGVDATAQRTSLGLGNVVNVNCTNASNITSGTLADARIASTITRDDEVNTATTTALNLKANLSSPPLSGIPTAPTATTGTNTTQLATTAFVVGQRAVNNPTANGAVAVGTSFLYAREDHVHPSDTTKANLASPTFTGTVVLPATTSVGSVSSTELGYLDGVTSAIQTQINNTPLSNRNKILNGAMLVDQKNSGAAQTITAGAALAYTVDRFYAYCTGANVTGQQVAGSVANTKRYRFTGAASVTGIGFGTRLEAINTASLSNKTATLQVKLSSSSLTSVTWTIYRANSNDTFGTVASPTRTQLSTGTFTINATEATYSAQISIPAAATTGIEVLFTAGALLGTHTLTIGDIQLESGGVATAFENVDYGFELLKCQRYYEVIIINTQVFNKASAGNGIPIQFRVVKRSTPTMTTTVRNHINTGTESYNNITTLACQCTSTSDTQLDVQRVISLTVNAQSEL